MSRRKQYFSLGQQGVLIVLVFSALLPARAQERRLTIIEPQEGKSVSEDLAVTVNRPRADEGYLVFRLDGVFKEATAKAQCVLDTKQLTDGEHTVLVEDHDGTGALIGTTQVKFVVANKIGGGDVTASEIPLRHWDYSQFESKEMTRYIVWAQGIALDKKPPPTGGAGAAGGAGGGGGQQQSSDVIKLDRQMTLKIRQVIRDVLPNGTANMRTMVEGGHERWRHYEQFDDPDLPPSISGGGGPNFSGGGTTKTGGGPAGGGPGGGGPAGMGGGPGGAMGGGPGGAGGPGGGQGKATIPPVKVWDGEGSCDLCTEYKETGKPTPWCVSPEVGRTHTRMIYPSGKEVNATRKYEVWPYEHATRIPMSELPGTFPDRPVKPGDTWQTNMTVVCELTERRGIDVTAELKFVGFEWQGGRKTAKLETEFDLPEKQAKEVGTICIEHAGAGSQGGENTAGPGGGGPGAGGASGGAGGKKKPPKFKLARVHVKRTIFFDYAQKKMFRSEDQVTSHWVFKGSTSGMGGGMAGGMMGGAMGGATGGGGGMMGGGGGAGGGAGGSGSQQPAEPEDWEYNINIITQIDDSPFEPSPIYHKGLVKAHDYDSVSEPSDNSVPASHPRKQQPTAN